jgi:hypothetical protein
MPRPDRPPTAKQLRYLRQLALKSGQTFATPRTRRLASAEIRRLTTVTSTGFTFAERQARDRNHDVPLYAPSIHPSEITEYGSTATWSNAR